MTWRGRRRDLLRLAAAGASVGVAAGAAGCLSHEDDWRVVSGRITDLAGAPVADATVTAIAGDGTEVVDATTDTAGDYRIVAPPMPVWLRVDHPDFLPTVRSSALRGREDEIAMTPDRGSVALTFGGDVMFGRRFGEPNDDPLEPQHRIFPQARRRGHRRALERVAPVLEAADVTSVNCETPLTTGRWRHPEKTYQWTSHPVAAEAMAAAGIDHCALGNNHSFDALTPGLDDTVDALDAAGVAHSGAGRSSDEAWTPALVERGGTTVGIVSCTTVEGGNYALDWSADSDREPRSVTQAGSSLTVPPGAGAAEASRDRIADAVERLRDSVDVAVVEIHGDTEYEREPTSHMRSMVDAAVGAGADLVMNHHPHVTGGIERREGPEGGALVAWSLGNLVFDQELWETLRSYLLTVHVAGDGTLQRAIVHPILLEGYVPTGVTGHVARKIGWETAALSDHSVGLGADAVEYRGGIEPPGGTERAVVSGTGAGSVLARRSGWVGDVATRRGATVRLGTDLLVTGHFENGDVDPARDDGVLWRYNRDAFSSGEGTGHGGSQGVRLTAHGGERHRTLLSPASRIPIDGEPLTFTGRGHTHAEKGVHLLFSWYDAAEGDSFARERVELPPTEDAWERVTVPLEPPDRAEYVNLFLFVEPPRRGERSVTVDELRLIEWAPVDVGGGRGYDHLHVDGRADVRFRHEGWRHEGADLRWTALVDDVPLRRRERP